MGILLAQGCSNPNPGVIPPNERPYGRAYAEWAIAWWDWALSIPETQNPIMDGTGEHCAVGQTGQVWFLAGTLGGAVTRWCTIPSDISLFVPIVNLSVIPYDDETDDDARRQTEMDQSSFTLTATVDGSEITNLGDYWLPRPLLVESIWLEEENWFEYDPGEYRLASDGVYLMLLPLTPGEHVIRFAAEETTANDNPLVLDVTYNLTVLPPVSER